MIGLNIVYLIAGVAFLGFAVLSLAERRWGNAAFHALLTISFLLGDRLGDLGNGMLVLAIVAIAGMGLVRPSNTPSSVEERPRGNGLIAVALLIPAMAVIGTLAFKTMPILFDARQATLVALVSGVLIALATAMIWLRPAPIAPIREGKRLMDDIGWAAILPQMLASLGAVFAAGGVGTVVGGLIGQAIPAGSLFGAVLAYGLGMALFTMVMGNAFAAFPVMAAAVGIPLLVQAHGGDPVRIAAIGMVTGFCGTLMTPMAANFNLVPAVLLGLKDRYGVIRAQVPTALALLSFNIILLWWVLAK